MVSISNVRSDAVATPAPVAAPAETAAPVTLGTPPEPSSKVTVLDERNAIVRDSAGRTLKVRRLSAIDKFKLFRAMGAIDSENRVLSSYAATAAACVEIDGSPIPFPSSSLQLDALITRLDETGLEAILECMIVMTVNRDIVAEAKN